MANPSISVIIPVYNVEKYLQRCLGSVLVQTLSDIEIICVNDGATDSSASILAKFAKGDSRIKIINQKNQGLSVARNNGFASALGEYIYFLDSDDFIHPQLLEITYNLASNNNADVVAFDFIKCRDFSKAYVYKKYGDISKIDCKITTKNFDYFKKNGSFKIVPSVWSKLFKKSIISELRFIPDVYFEDISYVIELLIKDPKTVIIDEKLYYYNKSNSNSIVKKKLSQKHITDFHKIIGYVYEKTKSSKYFDFIFKTIIQRNIKNQVRDIRKCKSSERDEIFDVFEKEIIDLHNKKCLRFSIKHPFVWFYISRIIRKYNNEKL